MRQCTFKSGRSFQDLSHELLLFTAQYEIVKKNILLHSLNKIVLYIAKGELKDPK